MPLQGTFRYKGKSEQDVSVASLACCDIFAFLVERYDALDEALRGASDFGGSFGLLTST